MLRRLVIWSAAAVVCVTGAFWVALLAASGAANYGESSCGTADRLPQGVYGYQGPQWVNPVTFRCVYPGHPDVLVTDWTALLGLVLGSVAVLGGIVLVCRVAHGLVRAWVPRGSG